MDEQMVVLCWQRTRGILKSTAKNSFSKIVQKGANDASHINMRQVL